MSLSDVRDLRQGDVVPIRFPFTDATVSKLRPAILVSDTRVVAGEDGTFVFCGSCRPPPSLHAVPIRGPDVSVMGLKREGFVQPWKLATLRVRIVERKLGRTPPDILKQILQQIERAPGITRL